MLIKISETKVVNSDSIISIEKVKDVNMSNYSCRDVLLITTNENIISTNSDFRTPGVGFISGGSVKYYIKNRDYIRNILLQLSVDLGEFK